MWHDGPCFKLHLDVQTAKIVKDTGRHFEKGAAVLERFSQSKFLCLFDQMTAVIVLAIYSIRRVTSYKKVNQKIPRKFKRRRKIIEDDHFQRLLAGKNGFYSGKSDFSVISTR